MKNKELENIINTKLNSEKYHDFCSNGLQVEGRSKIKKIISGVTACQKLLDIAVLYNADAVIVHHGFFWKKNSSVINGIYKKRLKTILSNNINLYCWHLPLDAHEELGNNAQIANRLNIQTKGKITDFVLWGYFNPPIKSNQLKIKITKKFYRKPFYYNASKLSKIKKIAWCSGKGQNFIHQVVDFNIDTFLTGEISEETIHAIREYKLRFFAAGHHATEIYGIKALSNWLTKNYDLEVLFINIHNPI